MMNSEASMLRRQSLLLIHFIYSKFPFKTHAHWSYTSHGNGQPRNITNANNTQPMQNQSNVGILGQLNQHSYWKCFSVRKFCWKVQFETYKVNKRGFTWPNLVSNILSRAVLLHLLPAVTDSCSYHHHLPLKISQVSYKYTHHRWEGGQIPSTWLHRNLNFVCRYLVIPA